MKNYEVTLRFLAENVSEDELWEMIWRIENLCKASDRKITSCWIAPDGVKEAVIEGKEVKRNVR